MRARPAARRSSRRAVRRPRRSRRRRARGSHRRRRRGRPAARARHAAALPARRPRRARPRRREPKTRASSAVTVLRRCRGRLDRPCRWRSAGRRPLTVFEGTAKPIPTLLVEPSARAICELTPITSPRAQERPARVAAVDLRVGLDHVVDRVSVRGGDRRSWTALTMPAVAVLRSPNGLPIATTGSPTRTASELPNASGARPGASTRRAPRCRWRVAADDRRAQRVLVREADLDPVGALDHVVVGDDVAGFVDHEFRAERLPRCSLLLEGRRRDRRTPPPSR